MASLMLRALPIPTPSRPLSTSYSNLAFSQSESFSVSFSIRPVLVSLPSSSPTFRTIYCGRGDRKTARGKRFIHSYGNARPRNKKKGRGLPTLPIPPGSSLRKDKLDEFDLDDSPLELDEDILDESPLI